MAAKVVDAWASTLEVDHPIDFDMANHYTSTHPDSPFVNRLMLRALTEQGRITVMNRDVTYRQARESQARTLADRSELRALLVEQLTVPSIAQWS